MITLIEFRPEEILSILASSGKLEGYFREAPLPQMEHCTSTQWVSSTSGLGLPLRLCSLPFCLPLPFLQLFVIELGQMSVLVVPTGQSDNNLVPKALGSE